VRIVFAEGGDSFSWNVVGALPFPRRVVDVVPGPALVADPARLEGADALVIGPGPTDPERAGLVRLVLEAARRRLPTLGICLGHQAIGAAFGAAVRRVPPVHGRTAVVRFVPSRLFPGFEGDLRAMRYHSLALDGVGAPLRTVATCDGLPMAIEHEALPIAGLQFHPDSYATERGPELLAAFFAAVGLLEGPPPRRPIAVGSSSPPRSRGRGPGAAPSGPPIRLSELDALPSFALLGPGFTGGAWRLLSGLEPAPGALDLALAGFEDRTPSTFRAAASRDGPLMADVAPAAFAPELDATGHADGVQAIRALIAAGDVYQVNLTLRARLAPVVGGALLATAIGGGAPPFAAWVRLPGGRELVSASPELLLEVTGRRVRSEPMKGTAGAGQELRLAASAKDAAELAMITDLVRNDLAPVCVPGSVTVTAERRLVTLPYAVQAVADVEGELAPGAGPLEALAALHPGGSVTGAPKPAALAAIAGLERTPRGAYCGALGHGAGARFVASLLIRTAERARGEAWTCGVGGGIVIDSDPVAELAEATLKLEALCGTRRSA
jgi:anthranilate synthase/aminodeoxychorismate synthase-like glutamine amidotransferase